MISLVKALRRQRPAMKRLLAEARVPVNEAEELLLAVMREIPAERWERMPRPKIDDELVRRVRAACAQFAARRRRRYEFLKSLGLPTPDGPSPLVGERLSRRKP